MALHYSCVCVLAALAALSGATPLARDDVWTAEQRPAEDELDRHMVATTGCFLGRMMCGDYYQQDHTEFDGALAEWRVALRAPGAALLHLEWDTGRRDDTSVLEEADQITTVPHQIPTYKWLQLTTGTLSSDRYIPFYVKIDAGTLTFGREGAAPLVSHALHVPQGETLRLYVIMPWTNLGVKILHDCPDNGPGVPA